MGDSPGEPSTRTREILSPSESTVPFRASHGIRFDINTFDRDTQASTSTVNGMTDNSMKLHDRWKDAMDQALLKDQTENDGLPDITFLASSQTMASTSHTDTGGSHDQLRAGSPTPTQDAKHEEQQWKSDPEYV